MPINLGAQVYIFVKEMRQSFERSQEFLDLEIEQTTQTKKKIYDFYNHASVNYRWNIFFHVYY